MKLILIRHGQTDSNVQNRLHKRNDAIGLDATGKDQACKTAAECKRLNVEVIFSSPEKRARETAHVIGEDLSLEPIILSELSERDWGGLDRKALGRN